jgi:serine/threonine protein kinase
VKVLDFGLAKAGGTPTVTDAGSEPDNSPTISMGDTQAGVGTVAYMAPEQAKGKPVDKRADIWAFGMVLYEMLTGRRLFCGETTTEILASVIKDEPEWDRIPRHAERLRLCLRKDPKQRLHDIADGGASPTHSCEQQTGRRGFASSSPRVEGKGQFGGYRNNPPALLLQPGSLRGVGWCMRRFAESRLLLLLGLLGSGAVWGNWAGRGLSALVRLFLCSATSKQDLL